MTPFYRVIKTIATPIAKLLIRHKSFGKENIPMDRGFILCCNHTSMIDIAALVVTCPRMIRFMGKEELFRNPVTKWFFRKMGGFPIARGKGDTDAIEFAETLVREGGVLGIFPEGTRTKDPEGRPGKGKAGVALIASATGADVLPCCIRYAGYKDKFRFFRPTHVHYGEIIKNEQLKIENNDRHQIRAAGTAIMGTITQMWEENEI